ncbi:MAG: hypothetical protein U1F66_11810 [bacterium]
MFPAFLPGMKSSLFLLVTLFALTSAQAAEPPLLYQIPPLEKLEQAALGQSGLDPGKISRWDRNARRAVALPRLQVGYEQKAQNNNTAVIQDSISVTSSGVTIGPEANRVDQDFGNNRGFEVKAVWALDELLFNRDELEISREARDLLLVRYRLQEDLQQAYYELKTQLLRFELEPESAKDPFEILKAQQLMDRLNSLSHGEFYKLLPKTARLAETATRQPESLPEESHEAPRNHPKP